MDCKLIPPVTNTKRCFVAWWTVWLLIALLRNCHIVLGQKLGMLKLINSCASYQRRVSLLRWSNKWEWRCDKNKIMLHCCLLISHTTCSLLISYFFASHFFLPQNGLWKWVWISDNWYCSKSLSFQCCQSGSLWSARSLFKSTEKSETFRSAIFTRWAALAVYWSSKLTKYSIPSAEPFSRRISLLSIYLSCKS